MLKKGVLIMPSYKKTLKNLDIPRTKFENTYTLITTIIIAIIFIFIVFVWYKVPATIPTHYDALGRQDDEGSKWLVIVLPALGFCIVSIMNLFKKHPEWANYPKRINESNAAAFYLANRQLLTILNNGIIIFFSLIALDMILVALEWKETANVWYYTALLFILIIIPIFVAMFKIRKIK